MSSLRSRMGNTSFDLRREWFLLQARRYRWSSLILPSAPASASSTFLSQIGSSKFSITYEVVLGATSKASRSLLSTEGGKEMAYSHLKNLFTLSYCLASGGWFASFWKFLNFIKSFLEKALLTTQLQPSTLDIITLLFNKSWWRHWRPRATLQDSENLTINHSHKVLSIAALKVAEKSEVLFHIRYEHGVACC